jgi:hypothetical protein
MVIQGASTPSSFAMENAAASFTPAQERATSSMTCGETFTPPQFITSTARPPIVRRPSSEIEPMSPE